MGKLNSVKLKGLKKVEIKDFANDASEWVELGMTTPDSFVISKGEDSVTEEFIEETDEVIDEITTQKGVREVSWSTKNVSKEVFQAIAGGKVEGNKWIENPDAEAKEVSVRAESANGIIITIPRVKIRFNGDLKFSKNELSQLTIQGKQLADDEKFSIQYPTTEPEAQP